MVREELPREEPPREEPPREELPREEGRRDKGKGRAHSPTLSERTPLLGSSRRHSNPTYDDLDNQDLAPASHPRRRTLRSKLCLVFLITFSLSVVIIALLGLLAYSYASSISKDSSSEMLSRALVVRGPDYISVLNLTSPEHSTDGRTEIWMMVHGRAGLDAGKILGVQDDEDENAPDWLPTYVWKALGRWGVRRLRAVTVEVRQISISALHGTPLADIDAPVPIELPLTGDMEEDEKWLQKIAIPVRVRPTDNGDNLIAFAKQSWNTGFLDIKAHVASVHVTGGGTSWGGWRKQIKVDRSNIGMRLRKQSRTLMFRSSMKSCLIVLITVPTIPGMPTPGRDAPLPDMSRLVVLQSFNLTSINDTVHIDARASAPNPAPEFIELTVPSLPFTVSLPSANKSLPPVPLAAVRSAPFPLQQRPNITILLSGHMLALPAGAESGATLSAFLARYMSGHASNISVSTPLYPNITFETVFPAPVPPPKVLRDLQLRDMRVKPQGSGFVASGTVSARVVLPRGMRFDLSVRRMLPDVLVFDGPVPELLPSTSSLFSSSFPGRKPKPGKKPTNGGSDDDDEDETPPAPPLPDPLPAGAFAHIRPEHWLPALSVPLPPQGDDEGSCVGISSKIVDVPLQILPGRERLASDFIGKVSLLCGSTLPSRTTTDHTLGHLRKERARWLARHCRSDRQDSRTTDRRR
jgi:hypothetical protein